MSFLNQLKSQANALQTQQTHDQSMLDANTQKTELACKTVWHYLNELAKHLNVLGPSGPEFVLERKARWPAMKLTDFRVDSRKKTLRDREVVETMSMGWHIVPRDGKPYAASVSVNFPPELERVEKRLWFGGVKFERKDIRHTEKNTLKEICFEYVTQARGYVTVTPDHDNARLEFRLANTDGFAIKTVAWSAEEMQSDLLDELAKLIVAQPSRFAEFAQ